MEKWKKQFYYVTVLHEIDYMHQKKMKQNCFEALYKYTATQKFHRDTHNAIVLSKHAKLKQKAMVALKSHIIEQREFYEKYKQAEEYYEQRLYSVLIFEAFTSLKHNVTVNQKN